jgi:hypothetical protein
MSKSGAEWLAAQRQARARWLRQQRQARGWNVPEMSRQLRRAAGTAGDRLPGAECLTTMIRRWENNGGVSERYRLHYCRAFQVAPDQFGRATASPLARNADSAAQAAPQARGKVAAPAPGQVTEPAGPAGPAGPTDPLAAALTAAPGLGYRGYQEPGPGQDSITREVLMAAHEGGERAERAERRDIGGATLEQLRADVIRLNREYMTGEPFGLFLEMRRVRARLYSVLDQRIWPRDQVDLYFLLGCLNGLMAVAANSLGNPVAAEELARAGSAYAIAIGHKPLLARLRLELASIAHWSGQPRRCADLARSGLEYLPHGPNGAALHLQYARAAVRLGDADGARRAITAAADAREGDYSDDVLAIGGEFGFSRASQHYYAGSVSAEIPGAETDAIAELEEAIELYAAGPEPGEDHSLHCKMEARVDLASARLRAGQLEAAATAAGPVLALPPGMRISSLPSRISRVRAELAAPRYRGSAQAKDLDEQIEQFCRDTITTQLHDLPAGTV